MPFFWGGGGVGFVVVVVVLFCLLLVEGAVHFCLIHRSWFENVGFFTRKGRGDIPHSGTAP